MADEASRKSRACTCRCEERARLSPPPPSQSLQSPRPNPVPAPTEEANKVIHIVRRLQEETIQRTALKRRPWVPLSIAVCVLLPTLSRRCSIFSSPPTALSPRRGSRSAATTLKAIDAVGMITGLPSSQIVSDSYIVADYIDSRDMVEELLRRLPLRSIYADGDFFSRVGDGSHSRRTGRVLAEAHRRLLRFNEEHDFGRGAGLHSRPMQTALRARSSTSFAILVNELSAQARRDAVQFAASEVARAELRVRGARDDILGFPCHP